MAAAATRGTDMEFLSVGPRMIATGCVESTPIAVVANPHGGGTSRASGGVASVGLYCHPGATSPDSYASTTS
ncbi:hypothetical protein GCM10009758_11610 [Microbacterium hatanonis]